MQLAVYGLIYLYSWVYVLGYFRCVAAIQYPPCTEAYFKLNLNTCVSNPESFKKLLKLNPESYKCTIANNMYKITNYKYL